MTDRDIVDRYHDTTKHFFHRFARSLGYLDWASQPNPFRSYAGADEVPLAPRPGVAPSADGDVLRHALGLSAWKRYQSSRWPLRVNPSSGNLHPTEAYVVRSDGVFHYAPDRHALERRCACEAPLGEDGFLIALTSIHWREAWKYGERAFRYCQHDLGHAIASIAIAAANAGLTARLAPDWSHGDIAAITGLDRDEDFVDAERDEPGCVVAVGSGRPAAQPFRPAGVWSGRANRLSEDHVDWPLIDEVAHATRSPFDRLRVSGTGTAGGASVDTARGEPVEPRATPYSRDLILRRRSAVALDGRSSIDRDRFLAILARVMPEAVAPWTALWWDARIHLVLFVHRVDGIEPGIYLLVRNVDAIDRLRAAIQRDFEWAPVTTDVPLFRLARGDVRALARRLSCDQDIAADGFFSLGMLADFAAGLDEHGPPCYRRLFWESGVVGQVLYLEAERAGARGTGIGCFYDDPVHDVLGLAGRAFQSLYHFTIGIPVEDTRLTTESGYVWERRMSIDTP